MSTLHARDGSTTAEVYRARGRDYLEAAAIAAEMNVPLDTILGNNGVQTITVDRPDDTPPPTP